MGAWGNNSSDDDSAHDSYMGCIDSITRRRDIDPYSLPEELITAANARKIEKTLNSMAAKQAKWVNKIEPNGTEWAWFAGVIFLAEKAGFKLSKAIKNKAKKLLKKELEIYKNEGNLPGWRSLAARVKSIKKELTKLK